MSRYAPIFFITSALILGGCGSTSSAPAQNSVEVGVISLSPQSLPVIQELSGRARASLVAEVRPEVGGIIKRVVFKEGQKVRAGELLYEINSDTYRAIYDGAVASLASANASLMSARVKKERYDELIKFEGVSKQDYDDAVAAYLSAEALVKERAASLNSAKINLDKTRITAPISGFIGISSVTEGALVTANQAAALSTIRSIDPMYVDLSQSSNQILELRKNLDAENLQKGSTQVSLKLFDGSMYAHQGILKLHEVAVDESTSSVTLRAEFPNPDGVLLPGMYVRAVLEEAVDANSYLVPQQAVLRDSRGNPIVTIATPNNTIITRVITAPRTQDSFWVVTDGVSASDKIIIEGLNRINTRSKVTPVDVSAKYIKAK